jgi:hypothetical protein
MKRCKCCGTILTIELFAKKHLGHNLDFCISCLVGTFTKIAEEEGIYLGVAKYKDKKATAK